MVLWVVITVVVVALAGIAVIGWRLRGVFSADELTINETLIDEISVLGQPSEQSEMVNVSTLINVNEQMKQQLQAAEDRLQTQARQIESHAVEARTDPLTQVANRRALEDELRRCVRDYAERGRPVTVMLIDVDHFKRFNDSQGHQAGDEVLRGVARVLRQSTGEANLVARFGGEEFAVVFPGASFASAKEAAERVRLAIASARFRYEGRELRVTASAGLAELAADESELSLMKRADEALYASKHAGRNCAHFNDGFANHPIKLDGPKIALPRSGPGQPLLGDEWLYDVAAAEITEDDPAAQVSSKPQFFDNLIARLSMLKRLPKVKLSMLLVEVEGLARIRSEHGDSAAAIVTRVVAQIFKAQLRDIDLVARLEDNTFSLLLPGIQAHDAFEIAERLQAAVSRYPLPKRAGVARVFVAIGAAEASGSDDLQTILRRSRKALEGALVRANPRLYALDAQDAPLELEMAKD